MGLGLFCLYYLTFTVARVMVEELTLPLVLGMWSPNIIFLIITLYIFYRVEKERSLLPRPCRENWQRSPNMFLHPFQIGSWP